MCQSMSRILMICLWVPLVPSFASNTWCLQPDLGKICTAEAEVPGKLSMDLQVLQTTRTKTTNGTCGTSSSKIRATCEMTLVLLSPPNMSPDFLACLLLANALGAMPSCSVYSCLTSHGGEVESSCPQDIGEMKITFEYLKIISMGSHVHHTWRTARVALRSHTLKV